MRVLPFLVDVSIHLRARSHTYVEVILRNESEGKFLQDSTAHAREKIEDVSKFGRS